MLYPIPHLGHPLPFHIFAFAAYDQWMRDNGGSIVNIIVDMWKGFPGMS